MTIDDQAGAPWDPPGDPPWDSPVPTDSGDFRRGKSRHVMRRWIIGLVVFVGLLIGADRIAVVVATNMAGSELQSNFSLDRSPSVNIGGFPFLTQVVAGSYDHIHVTFYGLQVSRTTYQQVDTDLSGVHFSNGFHTAQVDNVTGSVVLSYNSLGQMLASAGASSQPFTLAYGGGTTVLLTAVGRPFNVTVGLDPSRTNTVDLQLAANQPAGQAPTQMARALLATIRGAHGGVVPLSIAVPFGLHLVGVTPEPDGLHADFTGTNATFSSSSLSSSAGVSDGASASATP